MPDIDTPYTHRSGEQIVISQGIGGADGPWMAFRRRAGSGALKRISSPQLPCRETPEEVMADLRHWMGCPTEKRMVITAESREAENGLEILCRYENPDWPAPREYWFPETALDEEAANVREFGYIIEDERAAPAPPDPRDPPPPSPELIVAQGEGPGGVGFQTLPVSVIRTDGGTQVRVELNTEIIDDYAEALRAGAEFPPIIVYHDGENFWLADGFHRLMAAIAAGHADIAAEVRAGAQRDARLHAAGSNTDHGLRRTNADKRHAVMMLLEDPEWSAWSNVEIARRACVSEFLVRTLREELSSIKSKIDTSTVGAHGSAPTERTVERAGTTYTMRTDNIGQAPAAPPETATSDVGADGCPPEPEAPAPETKSSTDSIAIADAILRDLHEFTRHARRDNLSQEESATCMRDIISVHIGKALKEVRAYSYKLLLDIVFNELGLPPDCCNLNAARERIRELRALETQSGEKL